MEALVLTILSVFAFVGVIFTISCLLNITRTGFKSTDVRLILYIPHSSCSKLEGVIRGIFDEDLPKKCMTDGKVYLITPQYDDESLKLIETLKDMYPIVVLPEKSLYCIISERD